MDTVSDHQPSIPPKPATNKLAAHKPKVLSIFFLLLITLSVGFLGGWLGSQARQTNPGVLSGNAEQGRQIAQNQSQLISTIAKKVGPSVVSVDTVSQQSQPDFFGNLQAYQQQGAGTGFIISSQGIVITNRHVVPAGVSTVNVTLSDGTRLINVSVIGRTADNDPLDIAFLKINDAKGHSLQPAKLGDSAIMQVGDTVIAIGNALGQFQNTVTSGIISGYGRTVQAQGNANGQLENLQDLFQTDAAINEGNSGGPLVNANGEVIAINTAVAGNGAQNIGFAIPINDAQGLIKSVLNKGKLERPYIGVHYVSLNDSVAYQYNLDTKRGAYLAPGDPSQPAVIPGGPADKAGLQEKDIITKVNNQAIDDKNSLTSLLSKYQVGDQVTLTVIRNGKTITVPVTLGAAPQG